MTSLNIGDCRNCKLISDSQGNQLVQNPLCNSQVFSLHIVFDVEDGRLCYIREVGLAPGLISMQTLPPLIAPSWVVKSLVNTSLPCRQYYVGCGADGFKYAFSKYGMLPIFYLSVFNEGDRIILINEQSMPASAYTTPQTPSTPMNNSPQNGASSGQVSSPTSSVQQGSSPQPTIPTSPLANNTPPLATSSNITKPTSTTPPAAAIPCKNGFACTITRCSKSHPLVVCKFGDECRKKNRGCAFSHAKLCRNGATCSIKGCYFAHPSQSTSGGSQNNNEESEQAKASINATSPEPSESKMCHQS